MQSMICLGTECRGTREKMVVGEDKEGRREVGELAHRQRSFMANASTTTSLAAFSSSLPPGFSHLLSWDQERSSILDSFQSCSKGLSSHASYTFHCGFASTALTATLSSIV